MTFQGTVSVGDDDGGTRLASRPTTGLASRAGEHEEDGEDVGDGGGHGKDYVG
jgi:hypothetical protein